jgi:RimJ/RimL family protein N-acetyltransferase
MTKRAVLPIENDFVRLRLLDPADLSMTLGWRNQDHIRVWFFHSEPLTPEQHQKWFSDYQSRDDDFVFIIEDKGAGDRPVGQIALYHIDWAAGQAEYGRLMIGEAQARGKGLAKIATELVVRLGFEVFNLQEIYLEVFADNTPARAVYRAVGFIDTELVDDRIQKMSIRNPAL